MFKVQQRTHTKKKNSIIMSVVKRQKLDNSNYISLELEQSLITATNLRRKLYDDAILLENGHRGAVFTSKFSHSGSLIATGGIDKTILLWNLPLKFETDTEQEVQDNINIATLSGHKKAVTTLCWLAEDEVLVSGCADSTLGVWDVYSERKLRKLTGHKSVVNQVVQLNDDDLRAGSGASVASVSDDGLMKFWDFREKKSICGVDTEYPLLTCCRGTNNGRSAIGAAHTIYCSGIDPVISAYDMRKLDQALWTFAGNFESTSSLSLSPDGSTLASRTFDGSLHTFDLVGLLGKEPKLKNVMSESGNIPIPGSQNEEWLIRTCFSKNNINLVSGTLDGKLLVWQQLSGKLVASYEGHGSAVLDVGYHPLEDIVVSSAADGTIIVREL